MARRISVTALILAAAAMPAVAQTGPAVAPAAASCGAERAWVAAEETTPGILLTLAREALGMCLERAGRARVQPPVQR